ncbi:sodium/proton antiporter, NhaA family [Micromonospora pallida]|uniref:Na(+)/H(+) antiporter NhaA n=1 Tax=Micromonospora pallida TaxID=145854 RepID=A0A1C6S4S2_9ACTN|nr:Na+/H+ antiporter NhaA [Micromonospora pallida]SCL24481.1 sodium/proton antiporter, NhaA family [Micromonospora pallida]
MNDRHPTPPTSERRLFTRVSSWPEARFLGAVLRTETVGGGLLLLGAVLALIWANSPWADSYATLGGWVPWPGGKALHLDLDLATWAADGLLAVFFFVVGLELKREFVAGELRDPRRAALPVVAAMCGMLMPALFYIGIMLVSGTDGLRGWAIPVATDIAFALAVLAVIGSHLPQGLRAFLLTLAVVDDLLAIVVIAIFYTADFSFLPLLAALLPIGAFALLVQRRKTWWWALLPLAVTTWTLVHASGVHATIAGVLLGFTVPVLGGGAGPGLAEHLEHRWRPVSAGVAVPVFAFFAAGVSLRGTDLGGLLTDPVVLGIAVGLVFGKAVGVFGSTWLMARFTRAELDRELSWSDLFGVACLAGIGFTVSLLIGELAFGAGTAAEDKVKTGVLTGSLVAATVASILLVRRNAVYRRIDEQDRRDDNQDGVPDVYQQRPAAPN